MWLLGCFLTKKPESDDREDITHKWTSQEASTKKPLMLLVTGFFFKWLLDYEPFFLLQESVRDFLTFCFLDTDMIIETK